jgi:hypothetical protein
VSISWSPDSRKLAFISNRAGRLGHYLMNRDGSRLRNTGPFRRARWPGRRMETIRVLGELCRWALYMTNGSQPDAVRGWPRSNITGGANLVAGRRAHRLRHWDFPSLNWNRRLPP